VIAPEPSSATVGGRRLERLPDVSGQSRAEFLAELVSLRDSVVVAVRTARRRRPG
jgi:hypothetical protein